MSGVENLSALVSLLLKRLNRGRDVIVRDSPDRLSARVALSREWEAPRRP